MFIYEHLNISVVCPGEAENRKKRQDIAMTFRSVSTWWELSLCGKGGVVSQTVPHLAPVATRRAQRATNDIFHSPFHVIQNARYRGRSAEKTTFLGQIV